MMKTFDVDHKKPMWKMMMLTGQHHLEQTDLVCSRRCTLPKPKRSSIANAAGITLGSVMVVLGISQRSILAMPAPPHACKSNMNDSPLATNRSMPSNVLLPSGLIDAKVDNEDADVFSSQSLFQCPKVRTVAENVVSAAMEHEEWYASASRRITNVTTYMQTFRNKQYDAWERSYSEMKRRMTAWKSARYIDLKSGDLIYESACGTGMNLFMTLEILQQVKNVTNLTVYGNDYIPESVEIARAIAGNGFLPAQGRLGNICSADSTNLDFVPSDTFDLVFSGCISPLFDPLQLNLGSTDANYEQYYADCKMKDMQRRIAVRVAQQRQNDWYAAWVGEMIRIAKPGAPVIIEHSSFPLCETANDWGGVAPEFWRLAIRRYGWDIDPSSIQMELSAHSQNRYHVFMRKNNCFVLKQHNDWGDVAPELFFAGWQFKDMVGILSIHQPFKWNEFDRIVFLYL